MIRFKSVKRSVSLLLALSMSLCLAAAPVQAEPGLDAAATAYYVKQLRDLGVLDYEVTAQMYDQPVTRAQTYGAALGLLGELTDGLSFAEYAFSDIAELPEANRIQFAYEQGCLESAWKFEPEAGSTVGEALRLIVSEMGYQEIARELGDGGAGFVTMANRLGILKGLSVSRNDALTWETLVTLLHNSLDIEILHLIGYSADGLILGEVTGVTMLNVYFDIYEISGVVTANESTSLTGAEDAGEGYVVVGEQQMKTGDTDIGTYLGYYVDCYARLADGIYTVISAEKNLAKNRVWTIAAEDLLPENREWSAFRIVYEDEKGTARKLSLPADAAVIYNGKQLFDYTAEDLDITLGDLTVIDNTGSGTPSVVHINEYENYVVESYNASQQILYSKNHEPLRLDSGYDILIESVNGDPYDLAELTEYAVLSLNISRDGTYIHGVVIKDKVSGQITRLDESDGKIRFTMDSGTYTVSPGWDGKDGSGNAMKLMAGRRYVAYLDQNGCAAAFVEKSSGMLYGFLYAAAVKQSFGAEVSFKLFTDSGTWEELELADRVSVNGVNRKETELAGMEALFDGNKTKQQMVKVMLNNDNEITKVYTPNGADKNADADALTAMIEINKTTPFKTGYGVFSDYSYSMNGVVIFILPKTGGEYDDELFEVVGASNLRNDRAYKFVDFYDVSDTRQVKIATLEAPLASYDYWNNYAVYVSNVLQIYEDGETRLALECMNKGASVTYSALEEEYIQDVRQGDILTVHLNTSGQIDCGVFKLYDSVSGTVAESTQVNEKETHYAWYGTVTAKDSSNLLLTAEDGETRCIPLGAAKYVTVYDTAADSAEKMFRTGTAGEINKNAQIMVYVRSGDLLDITVFE